MSADPLLSLTARVSHREAFRSPIVLLLCTQYFCWSIGVYGFVLWLPSILKNASHMGMVAAGWLSAVPYLVASLAMLAVSWISDRTMNRKAFVWPCLLVGSVAFFVSFALGTSNFWLSYALLIIAGASMYAPYGPFFAIIPEILPKNVAGGAMALINNMGALGSFLGSYLVGYLSALTKSNGASYIFMASALALSALLTIIARPSPR